MLQGSGRAIVSRDRALPAVSRGEAGRHVREEALVGDPDMEFWIGQLRRQLSAVPPGRQSALAQASETVVGSLVACPFNFEG